MKGLNHHRESCGRTTQNLDIFVEGFHQFKERVLDYNYEKTTDISLIENQGV